MNATKREWRDYLEQAAECRRRGDIAAADAAELAALICLRLLLAARPERGAA